MESGVFTSVCVSSDDAQILNVASDYGALPVERPQELATDRAQVKDVAVNLLSQMSNEGEHYPEFAILLTTNPFRTGQDVKQAYEVFRRSDANYVMSLVPYSHPPQRAVRVVDGHVEPFLGHQHMKQTQRLEELYRHDGSLFFAKTDVFLQEGEQYGSKVVPYFIPRERSVDIDEPIDLVWAEFLLTRRTEQGRSE